MEKMKELKGKIVKLKQKIAKELCGIEKGDQVDL